MRYETCIHRLNVWKFGLFIIYTCGCSVCQRGSLAGWMYSCEAV